MYLILLSSVSKPDTFTFAFTPWNKKLCLNGSRYLHVFMFYIWSRPLKCVFPDIRIQTTLFCPLYSNVNPSVFPRYVWDHHSFCHQIISTCCSRMHYTDTTHLSASSCISCIFISDKEIICLSVSNISLKNIYTYFLCPKCRSRHKAIMVITVRAHCYPLDIYIYIYIYIFKLVIMTYSITVLLHFQCTALLNLSICYTSVCNCRINTITLMKT